MLAKAYSIVRGNREKEEAPLDAFFMICAPIIGVIPPEEYPQRMGWLLGPARDGDEEKIPQLTRLFVPVSCAHLLCLFCRRTSADCLCLSQDLASFPESIATTSLSVDDLVKLCHQESYIFSVHNSVPSTNTNGSLAMAVQPTATSTAISNPTNSEPDSDMPPLSPSEVELNRALLEALAEPPAGEATLSKATAVINGTGDTYPYNMAFDPANHFDVSFNPNTIEQGGAWDAFDTATMSNGNDIGGIDWDTFLNHESFA